MEKRNGFKAVVAALAAVATLASVAGTAYATDGKDVSALSVHGGAQRIAAVGSKNAKNVILFIGDGMGDSEITVARNYLHGLNGKFEGIDRLGQPTQGVETGVGHYTTFSLGGSSNDSLMAKKSDGSLAGSKTAGVLTPVTDSSASGSGWATGTKTYNNAVDIDVKGNPQLNLIELAKAAGKATGNVTTSEIQDATPAVLESHSSERACYGPQGKWDGKSDTNKDGKVDASDGAAEAAKRCLADQLKVNGGIGSISEQLLDTRADVTIGGGAKYFNQFGLDGKTLWDQAAARGFQTVKSGDVSGFKGLSSADQTKPVLALLGDGNLPTEFNPSVATKQDPKKDENPTVCSVNPNWLGNKGASLADFTNKAIDLLQKNPNGQQNGYFLQVEGASIDKQDHNANACGQIGETDDLDKAISAALSKVNLNDTLVIVTADHAHTSQIVESQPIYALSTVLKNRDGSKTVISYGTSSSDLYGNGSDTSADVEGKADPSKAQGNMSHTGTQLRIAASGPNASRVDGLTDQTDNFYTIGDALGLATSVEAQKQLSNNAQVATSSKDGKTIAQATGFNGDAVLAYQLTDASGKVVDQSASSTPLSGVRVQTAGTTEIELKNAKEGDKLTVTGRQSGKSVTVTVTTTSTTTPAAGPFVDVNEQTSHYEDILWTYENKISEGYVDPVSGARTYAPAANVTRQDYAAFLYRVKGSPDYTPTAADNKFADVNEQTPHYKEILWAAKNGYINGYTAADGSVTFAGTSDIQRQDAMLMLWRVAGKPTPTAQDTFDDAALAGADFQDALKWAKATKISTGTNGVFGVGSDIIRQDMAAFLHRFATLKK